MTFCFIGIGSNEKPHYHCQKMIEALIHRFGPVQVSRLEMAPALGAPAADYLNGVVCFEADISAAELKSWCRQQEQQLGRVRGDPCCVADLDILLLVDAWPAPASLPPVDSYYRQLLIELVSQRGQQTGSRSSPERCRSNR